MLTRTNEEKGKIADKTSIIAELEKIRSKISTTIGTETTLFKLIDMALKSGDLQNLIVAYEAYLYQPNKLRRAIENRWPSDTNEYNYVIRILKLQGVEFWDDKGRSEVLVRFKKAVTLASEDDFALHDVIINIAEATPKETVIKVLEGAIEKTKSQWDNMLWLP